LYKKIGDEPDLEKRSGLGGIQKAYAIYDAKDVWNEMIFFCSCVESAIACTYSRSALPKPSVRCGVECRRW
jgi:hypothetical protein